MKRLVLTFAALLALGTAATPARAAYTLTLQQTGQNVTIIGSGTLNLAALTNAGTNNGNANMGLFSPGYAYVLAGNPTAYAGLSGPANFGTTSGTIYTATSITGSTAGVNGYGGYLYVPSGYVSGAATSDTLLYANRTLTGLGFTPGTYTYTWGSGATADSLTVTSIVPEPSTWAAVALGAAGLGVVTLRRRAAVRA